VLVGRLPPTVCDQFRSVLGDGRRQRALYLELDGFLRHFTHLLTPGCARFVMLFTATANLLPSNIRVADPFPLAVSRNVGHKSPATAR
jgi:hypothetical protein